MPRHWFMDKAFANHAYEDKPFPIDKEQTISQPYTVARMTELLAVEKHQKVLEIGTGSGYQAAILAAMGARVFTVERQKALYTATSALLTKLNLTRIRCFYRDGFSGLPEFAPYDRIIVTAAASKIPSVLVDQLSPGGIMVIPVGDEIQEMIRLTKSSDNIISTESFGNYRFVPFLSGLDAE